MTRPRPIEDPILSLIGYLWSNDYSRHTIITQIAARFAVVLTPEQVSDRAGKAGFRRSPRYHNGTLSHREARVWERVTSREVATPADNAVRKSSERFPGPRGGYKIGRR